MPARNDRGGHHYYLRKPADLATVAHVAAYPGIDFKTVGGQVVALAAVHPETGCRYESEFWLLGSDETPDAASATRPSEGPPPRAA